jgi:hypothetical protein
VQRTSIALLKYTMTISRYDYFGHYFAFFAFQRLKLLGICRHINNSGLSCQLIIDARPVFYYYFAYRVVYSSDHQMKFNSQGHLCHGMPFFVAKAQGQQFLSMSCT